jgi:hypothetical protein
MTKEQASTTTDEPQSNKISLEDRQQNVQTPHQKRKGV